MSIVRGLVHGAVTGYFVRGIQIVASLLIIPFLLQDSVLGLSGYGRVFTLVGLFAIISMILDGTKLSQSRFIAQSLQNKERLSEVLGGGVKAVFLLGLLIAITIFIYEVHLLTFIGLQDTAEIVVSLRILLIVFVIETAFYSFEPLLHASERSYIVNLVSGVEVVGRNAAVAIYFVLIGPSIPAYFSIQLLFTFLRITAFYYFARVLVNSLSRCVFSSRISSALPMLRYSLPVSGRGISALLVYRGAVLVSSKFLGSEAAGSVSLIVGTVRNYIVQTLHGVFRPMMVPLLSRMEIGALPNAKISLIKNAMDLYTALLFLIGFPLIAVMPHLISAWLGLDYLFIVIGMQAIVFAAILELSGSIKAAMLVSQGEIKMLTLIDILFSILILITMIVLVQELPSWEVIVFLTVFFGVLSGGVMIEWAFFKCMPENVWKIISMNLGRLLSSFIMFGLSIAISNLNIIDDDVVLSIFINGGIALVVSAAIVHIFIIKLQDAISCTRQITCMIRN